MDKSTDESTKDKVNHRVDEGGKGGGRYIKESVEQKKKKSTIVVPTLKWCEAWVLNITARKLEATEKS